METLSEILDALRKPLRMAAQDDHALLPRVKGLSSLVPTLAERGACQSRNPLARKAFLELTRIFERYDQLPNDQRAGAIDRGLGLLDLIRAAEPSTPAAFPRNLRRPITDYKGVGPGVAARLEKLGIATAWDALWHLPRAYQDRLPPQSVSALRPGTIAAADVRVINVSPPHRTRTGIRIHQALFGDETGAIRAVWYNYQPRLARGARVRLVGKVEHGRQGVFFQLPEVISLRDGAPSPDDDAESGRIVPMYPLTEGVGERALRRILTQVVTEMAPALPELIPDDVTGPLGLPSLPEAMAQVHFPPNGTDAAQLEAGSTPAHRRLAFEELFFLELYLGLLRKDIARAPALRCAGDGPLERSILSALPWKLTRAQTRALREIGADLSKPHPMHRLLQGDVGSGKTIVALLGCARAIDAGAQAAVMAPTEILATQHFRTIAPILSAAGSRAALLTAGVAKPERARTLRGISEGAIPLVVGTHALIEEQVRFRRLALAVVDEQHRFGVEQRVALRAKTPQAPPGAAAARAVRESGSAGPAWWEPHMLVMTATPIPRSLALTVYGDLDLSVIDEMPPGREPVETRHYTERERRAVYARIRGTVGQGEQVFVVYPLVSESEKVDLRDATRMTETLRAEFPDITIGLVHGQMKPAEKDSVMTSFKRGEIQVLVATTVIEVGIDVPNATLMVVEHAERFGLSQLHQLRGRVGRGGGKSRCLLLTPPLGRDSEGMRRMRAMERMADGFRIAEEDLAIRGPGDFLGNRQHGLPDFRVASLLRDTPLISRAKDAARAILATDADLSRPEHEGLREGLRIYMEGRIGKIRAG